MANSQRPNSGVQYEVFNDKVVRASLNRTAFDAVQAVSRICHKIPTSILEFDVRTFGGNATINDAQIGKAKVNTAEGDTFDAEVGFKLARSRCLEKYHKAFDSRICMALEDARSMVAWLEHYCDKKQIDTSAIPTVDKIKEVSFRGNVNK